ncbi:MAG: shikimate kinase [Alistipes sp.]|nr:shikimate kinase [Alistipes sp.]MBO5331713.1 shikimate kinase [Alistipes sp.]MBP3600864.1 shikimate kinase [Alistipes sp.]
MKKIFLIGYMGCGKSSLGRKLAKAGGMEFMDMDSIIEQREGASISDIFHYQGEEYFRDVERALIEELGTAEGDMVISTGGGAPAWQNNMELMNSLGATIYLRRTAQQIASRLSPHGRQKRPKLRGLNDEELVAFMTTNMAEREPFYSKAKYCVDCAERSDAELIDYILQIVKENE